MEQIKRRRFRKRYVAAAVMLMFVLRCGKAWADTMGRPSVERTSLGVGATILPCFIGESDPALVRISPGETISGRDIWLLVRSDLRNVPRIRIFLDFFAQHIKSQKHLIESA